MVGFLARIIEKRREEMAFLPMVVFGYLYYKKGQLPLCNYHVNPLNGIFVYTGLAEKYIFSGFIIAPIVGSYAFVIYKKNPDTIAEIFSNVDEFLEELSKRRLLTILLPLIIYLILTAFAIISLLSRLCQQDVVIIALSQMYIIIFATTIFNLLLEY